MPNPDGTPTDAELSVAARRENATMLQRTAKILNAGEKEFGKDQFHRSINTVVKEMGQDEFHSFTRDLLDRDNPHRVLNRLGENPDELRRMKGLPAGRRVDAISEMDRTGRFTTSASPAYLGRDIQGRVSDADWQAGAATWDHMSETDFDRQFWERQKQRSQTRKGRGW